MNMPFKKIAFVIPSLRTGGAEKMLLTAANYLVRDYEVHIIFLKEEGPFLAALSPGIKRWNINNGSVYLSVFRIRKIIKQISPDIICPWMGFLNAYLIFFKPLFPKKIKWLCRESSIPSLMNGIYKASFLFNFFYRFYNRYDGIICQSECMAEDLVRHFSVERNKITVINNPVDFVTAAQKSKEILPASAFSPGSFQLLYAGGLNSWKRPHLLIDAMALLPAEYVLTILGEGAEQPVIEKMILQKSLGDRVRIITGCTNPFPYYSNSACLILCSTFEGFPNVVIEAMAAGCPAIGYGIKGGANEALAGYGGYVVDDGDINGLINTIDEICRQSPPDRQKISETCRGKYDLNKIMLQYKQLLNKICAG